MERKWRISILVLCASSLLISALEFYFIKRLEDPTPRVHMVQQIRSVRVATPRRR
jgi:hypothetical protein